jgi:very-short-patch-repair endonuclease
MPRAQNIVVGQRVDEVKVQRAKELRREMTPEEALLWQRLWRNQLGGLHFRRQQVIDGFIVDFYCHAAGVVVEVDGPIHREQADADRERDFVLTGRGLAILRFTNDEVRGDLPGALAKIQQVCEGRK